jgi:hypothetical protein
MNFFDKLRSVSITDTKMRNITLACSAFAFLISIAVLLSSGVSSPVISRVTDTVQKSLSIAGDRLSAAMYVGVTYSGLPSYAGSNGAYANFAAPFNTAGGYPAPLGCSRTNGSLTGTVCSQTDNFYNVFGYFGIYETVSPNRGYFQTFRADAPAYVGSHRGWSEFWSAPNIYKKTATGGEVLLTSAGSGLMGDNANEESIAAFIFNGGPSGDPGFNAPGFITPGAPSFGQFSNGRWLTINNGTPLAEDDNANDGALYDIVANPPVTGRPAFAPGGASALVVPAGSNMTLEWTCQPYQIQYWNESDCGGVGSGGNCSSAKSIRLFNSVTTGGAGFAQTARAGAASVRPYQDPTHYTLACVSPRFAYNTGYTVAGLYYRYVIPAKNGPTMTMTVNLSYPTPTGGITAAPPTIYLPLGVPSQGGEVLSWYVNSASTAICNIFGPTYVASSSATADATSGALPALTWQERLNCGSAAAPRTTVPANFTRPGTYAYFPQGAVMNTAGAWVFTTVATSTVNVSCGTKTTWNTATNQCQCQGGFVNSGDGINCVSGSVSVASLTVTPKGGPTGTTPSLTWSATNAPTSCTASGQWSGAKAVSGTNVVQPALNSAGTYTYTILCSNVAGPGPAVSKTVTICPVGQNWDSVSSVCAAPAVPVVSISAYPTGGAIGTVPSLTWSASNNPTSCTASGAEWSGSKPVAGTGVVQSALMTPGDHIYTLTCSNATGASLPQPAIVTICSAGTTWDGSSCSADAPTINSFNANPLRVRSGSPVSLTWNISNVPATGCSINSTPDENGNVYDYDIDASESVMATPGVSTADAVPPFLITRTTVFTLTCNGATPVQRTITVVPTIIPI